MVLELITNFSRLRHRPFLMFFEAFFITIISVIFSTLLFPKEFCSIGILAFITIGILPLFNKLYSYDSYIYSFNRSFFKRHEKIIKLLFYFFLGVFLALVLIFFISSPQIKEKMFYTQITEVSEISEIRAQITGDFNFNSVSSFQKAFIEISKNNLGVMFTAISLSFFYGAGGLFLIVWNASILSFVVIQDILLSFASVSQTGILYFLKGIFYSFINFLGYLPHGIFKFLAYFFASVAGAIFARDLFKGIFSTEFAGIALKDFLLMIIIALISYFLGVLIESLYFL
ncbi:MAG: hypothetical protein PHR26_02280 [Candidatus ainarchaeum sp.]|nr:hypothetical protein [Candidatus ainarchaeum sp.]